MHKPITKADAPHLKPIDIAANNCAAKIANWLESELEKIGDEDDDEYYGNPYNRGGEMIFDPPHQGSGFSGEFTDDDWFVPMWRDYSGPDVPPTVWCAMEKAFIAGANWQKRRSK